jgi:hypothetical protein
MLILTSAEIEQESHNGDVGVESRLHVRSAEERCLCVEKKSPVAGSFPASPVTGISPHDGTKLLPCPILPLASRDMIGACQKGLVVFLGSSFFYT